VVDLRRVDLNLLVAFDVLLEERSVTRAAKRLFVGQSSVSATLSRLRRLFHDPILVRHGRQLVATPVAEGLVASIRAALAEIESTLAKRGCFDPTSDHRTFSIVASDYVTLVFLQPLLRFLSTEAPNVRLRILPAFDDFADQLHRSDIDLLIIPREVFGAHTEFAHELLFRDRYVCAVDADHPEVGSKITLEQFCRLPYLATSTGHMPSLAEIQLDKLGIVRQTEITAGFTLAHFLLRGTRLISLVHERLGRILQRELNLRLLEPPITLDPFHELMIWMPRNSDDPGHRWLRQRMHSLALEMGRSSRQHRRTPRR
jgi:DNA-binding transcriptional LysR family regulator